MAYLRDISSSAAKVDEGDVDKVGAIAHRNGLIFQGALRADQHHVPYLLILEQRTFSVRLQLLSFYN